MGRKKENLRKKRKGVSAVFLNAFGIFGVNLYSDYVYLLSSGNMSKDSFDIFCSFLGLNLCILELYLRVLLFQTKNTKFPEMVKFFVRSFLNGSF